MWGMMPLLHKGQETRRKWYCPHTMHRATYRQSEVKWKSLSHVQLFVTLWIGQKSGVGRLFLLLGIFPMQGLKPGLPHCRWTLYQLYHQYQQRLPLVDRTGRKQMDQGCAHTMYRQPVPTFISTDSKGGERGLSRDIVLPLLTAALWSDMSSLMWGKRKFEVVLLLKL